MFTHPRRAVVQDRSSTNLLSKPLYLYSEYHRITLATAGSPLCSFFIQFHEGLCCPSCQQASLYVHLLLILDTLSVEGIIREKFGKGEVRGQHRTLIWETTMDYRCQTDSQCCFFDWVSVIVP